MKHAPRTPRFKTGKLSLSGAVVPSHPNTVFGAAWTKAIGEDVSQRTLALRAILLGAGGLGILFTIPLWLTSRPVPLLPVAPWFPVVPAPWDRALPALLLLCLAVAVRWYRLGMAGFLGGILFLYLGDQNRGQPWLYLYWVMLLLTLFPESVALAGCRLVLSATYVWAGIQKCNPAFFQVGPPFFVAPMLKWGLSAALTAVLQFLVACAPVVEIFIGLGLWSRRFRWLAVGSAVLVHVTALVALGPAGHGYNRVVWPWNIAMVALMVVLAGAARWPEAWANLRQAKLAACLVALVWLLPALSFSGRWDSYFSFSLYSANLATADIFMSQAVRDRLPPGLQPRVHRVAQPYDPQYQGPFVLDYQSWFMAELGVPPLPEPRHYRALFQHLRAYEAAEGELRMILAPRGAPPCFYQGQTERPLPLASPSRAQQTNP